MKTIYQLILLTFFVCSCTSIYRIKSIKPNNAISNKEEIKLPELLSATPSHSNSRFNVFTGADSTYYVIPTQLQINKRTFKNHLDGYYIEKKNHFLLNVIYKNDENIILQAINELALKSIEFKNVLFYPQNIVFENHLTGFTGNNFQIDSYWESNKNGLGKLSTLIQVRRKENIKVFKEQIASNNGFLSELKIPIRIRNKDELSFITIICRLNNISTSNQTIN